MRTLGRLWTIPFFAVAVLLSNACGSDDVTPDPVDDTPEPEDTTPLTCADLPAPVRSESSECDDVDAADPTTLVNCSRGSGYVGGWTVDPDGLPAYDFTAEQRCDPAASHWSPRETPQRDPVHLIGNGRGLVAMAHASGGVEIYTQDRGHKWINRVDTWTDPENPDYPLQLGGGFSYLVDGDTVHSTRFEDLPLGKATEQQSRRFGTGYVETVTTFGDLRVTRRVFAPDHDARALIAEVTVENLGDTDRDLSLVEMWDLNTHQIPVALTTSDLLAPKLTEAMDRSRRDLMDGFEHQLTYDARGRMAIAGTRPLAFPDGITSLDDVTAVDYFPDRVYLAALDTSALIDGVWLHDNEFWGATSERGAPDAVTEPANAETRNLTVEGSGQQALLAMRVPLRVPQAGSVTRRFAFGYTPGTATLMETVDALREAPETLAAATASSWKDRLVWAAFPGLPAAGAMQREIAWGTYNALAHVTFDEYRGTRLLGQGGAYKYIHGLDGALGDLALFAESMLLVDPDLARDTLEYSFASQHAGSGATPWRYPYATAGVGNFEDVVIYKQRSDAYFLLPWMLAEYVSLTRDDAFLSKDIAYWPKAAGESGSALDHVARSIEYANDTLGIGARGFVAMGTGDYADGVLSLSEETTTATGTSSLYNAGFVVAGFSLAADVFSDHDAALAAKMRALHTSQVDAYTNEGWGDGWYRRGFADNGEPLVPNMIFLEPQVLPILAGIVDDARRAELFALIKDSFETDIGAASTVYAKLDGPDTGGIDQPLIGGIWPVANAWLTEVYAMDSPTAGWDSFIRNSLNAHSEAYPDIWYGIWTGPDSFNGPEHERPGEADAHLATALTDYPALNAHMHTSPLRALMGLLGIAGTKDGLRIDPRLPTETYSVVWPRLTLQSKSDEISGIFVASGDDHIEVEVTVPESLRTGDVSVTVDAKTAAYTRRGDAVVFWMYVERDKAVAWSISR